MLSNVSTEVLLILFGLLRLKEKGVEVVIFGQRVEHVLRSWSIVADVIDTVRDGVKL